MSSTGEIKICELFTALEDDWRKLYEAAFPANERESESKLAQLISANRLLYHKTTGKNGELLCFSMVSLAPEFSFLAYLATDPNQRSGGVGSKHMKRLLELLKEQYPEHYGMLLEIDAVNPQKLTISDDERKIRQRRLGFYRRLGAKKLCGSLQFLGPSRKSGGTDVELDLLFFNFTDEKLDCPTKKRLVSEIYQRFYCLDPDEPLVLEVMRHFGDCVKHDEDCAEDQGDVTPSPDPPAEPVPAEGQVSTAQAQPSGEKPDDNDKGDPAKGDTSSPPQPAPGTAEPGPPAESDVEIVESDCEVLEKMGKKVECECQSETPTPADATGQNDSGGPAVPPAASGTQPIRAVVCAKAAARTGSQSTGVPQPAVQPSVVPVAADPATLTSGGVTAAPGTSGDRG